jgi:hypothetical protein
MLLSGRFEEAFSRGVPLCYLRSARRTTAAMSNRPRHRFGRHES